jgi:hypothetical protein
MLRSFVCVAVGMSLLAAQASMASPLRSADFSEQDRILVAGPQLETETEIAGSDLLPWWYVSARAAPSFEIARRSPFEDPSEGSMQFAVDVGLTRGLPLDVHASVWATTAIEHACAIEPRLTFPLGLRLGAIEPYAGVGDVSDRVRRLELDIDRVAWGGITYVTPDLYGALSRGTSRDRLQLRLRLSAQADMPTYEGPRSARILRPHLHAALPLALGWSGFTGLLVGHELVRTQVGEPWDRATYVSLFYGLVDWKARPFARARWSRVDGEHARDVSVGVTVELN